MERFRLKINPTVRSNKKTEEYSYHQLDTSNNSLFHTYEDIYFYEKARVEKSRIIFWAVYELNEIKK